MCDNIESIASKQRGWPKGKRRKKLLKDGSGPKKSFTGYGLFMKQRRETLAKENMGMPLSEITKLVGEEWSSLTVDQKSIFLKKAQKQKKTYMERMKSNKPNETDKQCTTLSDAGNSSSKNQSKSTSKTFDDPIFTESFLDYNKAKESELHQLNRTNAEYEQQNCVMEKHVDNLKAAIIKLEAETHQQTIKNKGLESKLLYFRELLCLVFSHISLPTTKKVPTAQTIDSYLEEICHILENSNDKNQEFASLLYDAMTTVSFQSLNAYWDDHKAELDV